jgi:hypothetical protein
LLAAADAEGIEPTLAWRNRIQEQRRCTVGITHLPEVSVVTSKKDAAKAGKQLKNPKATSAQKSVAGSDLAQAKAKGSTSSKAPKTKK